jgi:hypothetical protein
MHKQYATFIISSRGTQSLSRLGASPGSLGLPEQPENGDKQALKIASEA